MSPAPADQADMTAIPSRLLARIAAQAAAEEPRLTERPEVFAIAHGHVAALRLGVSVRYPAPVPEVAARVRDRVRQRVWELTGIIAETVDIEVARLVYAPGEPS